MEEKEATLNEGEPHPAAHIAMEYLAKEMLNLKEWSMTQEAIASTALSGNRSAEICFSTLQRLQKNEPVSDRYVMGLAWMVWQLRQMKSYSGKESLDKHSR